MSAERRHDMHVPPRIAAFLLALGVLAAPLAAQEAKEEPDDEKRLKAGDRDPEFILRVNTAIGKGIEWLLKQQAEDGSFKTDYDTNASGGIGPWPGGTTALSLLALLKSGVGAHDDAIEKGFAFLRTQPLQKTYTAGLTLMALEARWRHQNVEDRIRGGTQAVQPAVAKIPPKDIEWMKELTVFLLESITYSKKETVNGVNSTPKDCWTYPPDGGGDHSNTQYAILGLRSAQNCGVPIPRGLWEDVWATVIDHFVDRQEREGPKVIRVKLLEDKEHGYVSYKSATSIPDTARGWTYFAADVAKPNQTEALKGVTGSMTSVGVASVIIAMDCLTQLGSPKLGGARRADALKAANDGLAWLTHNFSVETNPGHLKGEWHYYYLYGLERACVLAGARNLGQHDWYREGAEWLLGAQSSNGSWTRKASNLTVDSCFALLFLTKATMPGKVQITR
jgi:hypothetical protein